MNILYFTHERAYGGASRALITLIDEIKDNVDKIYVVVPFKNAKIVDELKKRNITIINMFYGWWQTPVNVSFFYKLLYKFIYYFINPISFLLLSNKLKKLDINIIHSNTSVIDIGAKIALKLKINHIWHFREFTGTHLKFIKSEIKSIKFINNSKSHIIFISNAIKKFYTNIGINNKNFLVYDGVPKKFIINRKYFNKNDVVFLLVATLEKNKGQMLVINAAKYLNSQGISNFNVIFAGGDPTNYSSYLQKEINSACLQSNFKFVGFVNNMNELRQKVDVELMCAPSEAFGLVTVEGMMAGNPIIGSNSGATPEIITTDEIGFLYEANNYIDLAKQMNKIISNPDLIKKMGKRSQDYAILNFSSSVHGKNVFEIYKNLGVK